jgi:hypothetical protein
MSTINVDDLFSDAQSEGVLSPGSASLLTGLSARIAMSMQPLAVAPTVSEQTLLIALLDNTPSMQHRGRDAASGKLSPKTNAEAVIDGHNLMLESLAGAKAVNSIEYLPLLINPDPSYIQRICGRDEFTWKAMRAADQLVEQGFIYGYSTPLYERALTALGSAVARTKFWEDTYSVQTRSVTVIMSDGENNSGRYKADDVKALVGDMQAAERHRIFYWGLQGSDTSIDFHEIGRSMGIPDDAITVIPSDPKAIRALFQLFSQSMSAAAAASDDDFGAFNFGKV